MDELACFLRKLQGINLPVLSIEFCDKSYHSKEKILTFHNYENKLIRIQWQTRPALADLTKLNAALTNPVDMEDEIIANLSCLSDEKFKQVLIKGLTKLILVDKSIMENI